MYSSEHSFCHNHTNIINVKVVCLDVYPSMTMKLLNRFKGNLWQKLVLLIIHNYIQIGQSPKIAKSEINNFILFIGMWPNFTLKYSVSTQLAISFI